MDALAVHTEPRVYHVLCANGSVYRLDPASVVRDWGSAYPVGPNEWARRAKDGWLGRFNACTLMKKDGRELISRSIVVVRLNWPLDFGHDAEGEEVADGEQPFVTPLYCWCVRLVLRGVPGSELGRDFLWQLCSEKAHEFYDRLCRDPTQADSALVNEYEPCNQMQMLHGCRSALLSTRVPLERLEGVQRRLFAASVRVKESESSNLGVPVGVPAGGCSCSLRPARISAAATGGTRPLPAPSRRSDRFLPPPMEEVLSIDALALVVGEVLGGAGSGLVGLCLPRVLDLRRVSRTFRAIFEERMARMAAAVLALCRAVRRSNECSHVQRLRDALLPCSIHVLHAADEQRAFDETWGYRRDALAQHALVRVCMRLCFNKPPGAKPPRRPARDGDCLIMSRAHGAPLSATAHGYGTRNGERGVVRLRMRVPWFQEAALRQDGWETVSDEWVGA